MHFDAVIFDLDGTLLDTLADIAESSNTVLAGRGLPTYPVDDYRQWVGAGLRRLYERVLPPQRRSEALIAECIDHFRGVYARHWNVQTKPYDEVPELLARLASRQVKMAVLSNKPDEFAGRCVREYFSDFPFEMVLGDRDGVPPKPDPAGAMEIVRRLDVVPERFVYLGDTPIDMKTAVAAGLYPVGALWGFRPMEELRDSGARQLIEHPLQLLDVVCP